MFFVSLPWALVLGWEGSTAVGPATSVVQLVAYFCCFVMVVMRHCTHLPACSLGAAGGSLYCDSGLCCTSHVAIAVPKPQAGAACSRSASHARPLVLIMLLHCHQHGGLGRLFGLSCLLWCMQATFPIPPYSMPVLAWSGVSQNEDLHACHGAYSFRMVVSHLSSP